MLKQSLDNGYNLILNNSIINKEVKDASVQSRSPILSLARRKYHPTLKKIDFNCHKGNISLIKNCSISVNKYGKLAHYNIYFQQGKKRCKYKRILPSFHLNPEDSSIYNKKNILFKQKSNSKINSMLIETKERFEKNINCFQSKTIKTNCLSPSMSTDKLSLSEKFWITNNSNSQRNIHFTPKRISILKSIEYGKANSNLSNSCLTYIKKPMYKYNMFLKRNTSKKKLNGIDSYLLMYNN